MAAFNKAVLDAALKSRSLSEERLSKRVGVNYSKFIDELSRDGGPSRSFLKSIAKELSLPTFVFYMKEAPRLENNLVDFRHPNPRATEKTPETMGSIQIAHSIQREAVKLSFPSKYGTQLALTLDRSKAASDAKRAREHFKITLDDQRSSADARLFYYLCRRKIEESGIFVLQESFPSEDGSGFALAHARYPVIVVNSHKQNYARRLFTLVHELAHILLKESGISDPFVRTNEIERYCNSFAAEFLVSKDVASSLLAGVDVPRAPTLQDITRISRRLKISQQATVLRLEELGLVNSGSHESWLRSISNLGNPDFKSGGGGTTRPPEYKIKFARYGFQFANTFEKAISEKKLTDVDLYRIAGIKPHWLAEFFEFAREGDLKGIEE